MRPWFAKGDAVLNVLEMLGQAGIIQTADGVIQAANSCAGQLFGQSTEDLRGRRLTELGVVFGDARKDWRQEGRLPWEVAVQTGNPIVKDLISIASRPDVRKKWCEVSCMPMLGNAEEVCVVFGACRDGQQSDFLSDAQLIEDPAALKAQMERLDLALQATGMGTWRYDFNAGEIFLDAAACHHFGFSQASITLAQLKERIHPEDLSIFQAHHLAPPEYPGAGGMTGEYRVVHADGSLKWLAITSSVQYGAREVGSLPVSSIGVVLDLSECKHAELALHDASVKLSMIAENVDDVIWIMNPATGKLTYVSPSLYKMLGYRPQELINGTLELIVRPYTYQEIQQTLPARLDALAAGDETARTRVDEIMQVRKDGQKVLAEVVTTVLTDEQGQATMIVGVTRDIGRRVELEQAMRQTEEIQRALLEAFSESVLLITPEGGGIMANSHTLKRLGITIEQFKATNVFDLLPADLVESRKAQVEQVVHTGQRIQFEDQRFGRTIVNQIEPITDSFGNVSMLAIFGFDITDRIRSEEKLRDSEARFRTLIESGPLAIVMVRKGMILYANAQVLRLFGYDSAEALIDHPLVSLYAHEESLQALDAYSSWSRGEIPGIQLERIGIKRDGTRFDLFVSINKVHFPDGPAEIAFFTDITERRRNEKELARYREHLEELIEERTTVQRLLADEKELLSTTLMSIGEGVIVTDKEGFITLINRSAEKITGFAAVESLDQPIINILPLHDSATQEAYADVIDSLIALDVTSKTGGEYKSPTLICRNGSKLLLSTSTSALRSALGEVVGYVIVFQDITERHRFESQTNLSLKMEAIGQLAAGIAHEINTPTQYIGDNLKFLNKAFSRYTELLDIYQQTLEEHLGQAVSQKTLDSLTEVKRQKKIQLYNSEVPNAVEEALEGIERVRKIVLAMREFTHPSEKEKKLADINHGIETTIAISRNEWKYVAEMEAHLDQNLPLVNCQIDEINQVILNMIVNAAQAIREKHPSGSEQKEMISISTCQDGQRVRIIIRDSGPGIPLAIRARIFDPFFTTKGIGKGTGQGLSLAHNIIVKKHHGTILVDSEVGKGTTFTIELPLDDFDKGLS